MQFMLKQNALSRSGCSHFKDAAPVREEYHVCQTGSMNAHEYVRVMASLSSKDYSEFIKKRLLLKYYYTHNYWEEICGLTSICSKNGNSLKRKQILCE